MNRYAAFLLALVTSGVAGTAWASLIPATGNTSDQGVQGDGTFLWVGQPTIRIGRAAAATTISYTAVLVFQLPALPANEEVTSADLAVTVTAGNDWRSLYGKGVDLYALRVNTASTVVAGDYFLGSYGTDLTEATPIQQNFLYQPNNYNGGMDPTQLGTRSTDAAGDASLGAWLQSIYDADPSAAGKYVFLRLNSHGDITTDGRYWEIGSMNNTTVANRPTLMLTTAAIPEPATGLVAAGALLLAARRRRRRRP